MKPIWAIFMVLCFRSFLAPGKQAETNALPLGQSLYILTDAGCNTVVFVTKEGLVVVDPGENPAAASALLEKIRLISPLPVLVVVFTHCHHALAAHGFPDTALVISQAETRNQIQPYRNSLIDLLKKSVDDLRAKTRQLEVEKSEDSAKARAGLERRLEQLGMIASQKDVLPQLTFEVGMTIHLGGKKVELLSLGPGHTSGDILVRFPAERVTHVGDLLFTNGWVPRLDGDAGCSSANWIGILEQINRWDVEKIIPGHGEAVDRIRFAEISRVFVDYLTDLRAEVQERAAKGHSLERIKAETALPKYEQMGMADTLLPWNIEGIYREIRASESQGKRGPLARSSRE